MFKKIMKSKYNFNPILYNRAILYFFVTLALLDTVYFLNTKDYFSFAALILVGILTSFFNKNMTIILFIALIVTHILKYGKGSYSEGMTSMDSTTSTNSTDKKTTDEKPVSEDKKVVDNVGKIDESLEKLSKVKDMSDRILDIDKNGIDPEKTKEMADDLTKMKVMKNKIVEQVKGMQPMIENFYGHIEKMKNNTISLQEKVKL